VNLRRPTRSCGSCPVRADHTIFALIPKHLNPVLSRPPVYSIPDHAYGITPSTNRQPRSQAIIFFSPNHHFRIARRNSGQTRKLLLRQSSAYRQSKTVPLPPIKNNSNKRTQEVVESIESS
jgi:hypothetical protein